MYNEKAPHLEIIVNGIKRIDYVVDWLDMSTDIYGNISLLAKQPASAADHSA